MNRNQAAILIYGVLYIVMGVHGFIGKNSMMSLMAGGTIGIIEIGLAAYSKSNPSMAYRAAAGLAFFAGLIWVVMPLMPHKNASAPAGYNFYPEIVGMVISFGLALFLLAGHFLARKTVKSIDPKA